MRADRLLDLVALLRRHERITAADLAERLGVSRRTILRDIDALSLSGVPVFAEHGRGGGFSILPGYRPETAGLTAAESAALFLPGGQIAADAIGRGAEFRSARRKFEAVLDDDAARGVGDVASWLLVVPEGWGTAADTPAAVPHLAAAAARREVIDIAYRARGQGERLRRVRPVGVVLAARTWHLVAEKDDTGEQRTYRADRVGSVRPTGQHFTPATPLAQAWERARESYSTASGVTVRLVTDEACLPTVRYVVSLAGRVCHVSELGDGTLAVTGVVERLPLAAAIFAGLAHLAEITDPPELRDAVAEISRRNLARYAPDAH
ncbi:helix-turn-helix transcriptional regulator [Mobilicoccus caccae]|uniref:Transcriptional regulator n=1 Tax=Mobilicoccus caccae TaxID=1859295 RepID=A0ABQ6IXI5_9MICO|nr:WYL domain-containing protein [Mobilicoccus caccae]GMA41452.1 transcriptional regulator [Mobilicoccus caccae]